MNLHGMARGLVGAVNPEISVTLLRNTGTTTAADGKRTATFAAPIYGVAQVQGVSGKDLQLVASLNIQGIVRAVYLNGVLAGVNKASGTGGDILKFPEYPGGPTRDWKIAVIKDAYPDWTSAIVVMQSETV